jgi:dolichyl-phosphate-mannose--protein O-mannosyl transferase
MGKIWRSQNAGRKPSTLSTKCFIACLQRDQIKHWVARVGCLIVLPILVFMASFKIHFIILNESGPGDSQMSSLFQANLQGNSFADNPLGRQNEAVSNNKITNSFHRSCIWI